MLRVVSVPADHPYVRATAPADVDVLPDPPVPGAPAGVWWPPQALRADWVRDHADAFDVLHVHFGYESEDPDALRELAGALRAAGRPLVVTVHDLDNPQLVDQQPHHERTGVLVRAAAVVLTLTAGAADEVRRRWDRDATVVPHPHVLPLEDVRPLGTAASTPVVGVDLKDLRPDVAAEETVRLLASSRDRLGHDVVVRVRDRVRDVGARDRLHALCDAHGLRVEERARPDDAGLARSVADLDVVVLPTGHGTHSGYLELAWDLGVPVVVADVGHHGDQHPPAGGVRTFRRGDAEAFAGAVRHALADATRPGTQARAALVRARRDERAVRDASTRERLSVELHRAVGAGVDRAS